MKSIDRQIKDIDSVICGNIESLKKTDRKLLSQNILQQLRHLVEHVALKAMAQGTDITDEYENIQRAIRYIRSRGELSFLRRFHDMLQISVSHYTVDGDSSERLMLKYYEYLLRIKQFLHDEYQIDVLANLNEFPVDIDPSFTGYHKKIAEKVVSTPISGKHLSDRYYIHSVKPFFVNEKIYYEVTFYEANDWASKSNRSIAFTSHDITQEYALKLSIVDESIDVFGSTMPIKIIDAWEVSIRPCEINNFSRILHIQANTQGDSAEYRNLMQFLTSRRLNLLDIILAEDAYFHAVHERISSGTKGRIFETLVAARHIIISKKQGANVLRYLLLRLNNRILKLQYEHEDCRLLSGLKLAIGCKPFDEMPFCTSLLGHNEKIWDILRAIDTTDREHEFLARRVRVNVEQNGTLYTPTADLTGFGDVKQLADTFNRKLYKNYRHQQRRLEFYKKQIYIKEYEDNVYSIIQKLVGQSTSGIGSYENAVRSWLKTPQCNVDSPEKAEALPRLFSDSKVAIIYGAAGTGKSTMINHISQYFNDKSKLYLANTNPAVDNLRRRVKASNTTFRTIAKHNHPSNGDTAYDVVIIDECSTVSNSDMVRILENTTFSALVLVGDIYQIESILFGNWFMIARYFMPSNSIFELTHPYRADDEALLTLWDRVRGIDDNIVECLERNSFSSCLDESIFRKTQEDEIILCLNYDGLYGINNINRFLQSSNPNPVISWGSSGYKVGDPVLFNEIERFKPVIYNNLKGKIVRIVPTASFIQFDVEIDKSIDAIDVRFLSLALISNTPNGKSIIRFNVDKNKNTDEDDDSSSTVVPFHIAYAVSIHKAQGLEYSSVKVVITDEIDERVTHNIFYTAITRARESLKIYWSPEVQNRIISSLEKKTSRKDMMLLSTKYSLTPRLQ